METKEEKARKELKKIFDGMVYHMRELSEFMADHLRCDDPFFKTKMGSEMQRICLNLTMNHVTGLIKLGALDGLCGNEEKVNPNPMEDILKHMIDED